MPNDLRAWRVAALPCLAVLGVALPLTFASHCDQYLYDFRGAELLPLYATAWLVLAAVAVPCWIVLTLGLRALETVRRPPGPRVLRAAHAILIGLAAAIIAATLIHCLRTWLGTFGGALPLTTNTALVLAIVLGALAALTVRGRSAVRALAPVAAVFTVAGVLSLASLPLYGWHRGAVNEATIRATADGAPSQAEGAGPALAFDTSATLPANGASRPNIILLTIDALSAQHMSLYGYARPTTPYLTEFARGAVTFDRAFSNGNYTTPGVSSILTGTMPWTHRALQLPVWPRASTRRASLPAVLSRAGYTMGYVSTNAHAGAATLGFGRYFQFASKDRMGHVTLCADGLSAYLRFVCAASELAPLEEMDGFAAGLHGPSDNLEHDPRLATRPALHWLATVNRAKPIFLWVHLFPPHSPYAAPRPWLGRFDPSRQDTDAAGTQPAWAWLLSQLPKPEVATLQARYDESTAYVDYHAAQFLQRALELLGPNTVIVVTADHGESFTHGYGAHTGPGLYNEIIHIPLIIKFPDETVGKRCDALAEQADIAPTLAALAGAAAPASWEGHSLIGACAAQTGTSGADRPVFSMNFEQNPRYAALKTGSVAVIDGRWKLIHYMGALHYPHMPQLRDELYDIVADPGERANLAAEQPAIVQRLLGLIDQELALHGGRVVRGNPAAPVAPAAPVEEHGTLLTSLAAGPS